MSLSQMGSLTIKELPDIRSRLTDLLENSNSSEVITGVTQFIDTLISENPTNKLLRSLRGKLPNMPVQAAHIVKTSIDNKLNEDMRTIAVLLHNMPYIESHGALDIKRVTLETIVSQSNPSRLRDMLGWIVAFHNKGTESDGKTRNYRILVDRIKKKLVALGFTVEKSMESKIQYYSDGKPVSLNIPTEIKR